MILLPIIGSSAPSIDTAAAANNDASSAGIPLPVSSTAPNNSWISPQATTAVRKQQGSTETYHNMY